MTNTTNHSDSTNTAGTTRPRKKPLDPHLFSGPKGVADDVRVQTGYPIWNLIAAWMASNYDDEEIIEGYAPMPREEWEAAKRYYADHKAFIDARIVANSQPAADDDVPPMRTADEYFVYLAERAAEETAADTSTAGDVR